MSAEAFIRAVHSTNQCTLNEGFRMLTGVLRSTSFCLLMTAMSGISPSQSLVLDLLSPSQQAEVSQRIGITDITITDRW